jgi:hypothetical protein
VSTDDLRSRTRAHFTHTHARTHTHAHTRTHTPGPRVSITIPKDEASGYVNNKRENQTFKFRHIFPPDSTRAHHVPHASFNSGSESDYVASLHLPMAKDGTARHSLSTHSYTLSLTYPRHTHTGTQDDIFDVVAVPVVDSVLEGYNGTIFAYGQTGSGKTFTITGGAERYNDRGIIPRVLTHLFEQFAQVGAHRTSCELKLSSWCTRVFASLRCSQPRLGCGLYETVGSIGRSVYTTVCGRLADGDLLRRRHVCFSVHHMHARTPPRLSGPTEYLKQKSRTSRSITREGTICWTQTMKSQRWKTYLVSS